MTHRIVRRLVTALCLAVGLSWLTTVPSEAAAVPKVSGLSVSAQDWYNARLTVRWKAVSGASYQVRWSSNSKMRSASAPVRTSRARGTSIGPLDRGRTWYLQARAVKHARHGAWSKAKRARFTNKWPAARPSLSGVGVDGGVKFAWPYVPYASRYRVRWSPAPYGKWPGSATYVDKTTGGWVSQYARSSARTVPAAAESDTTQTAVAYANPLFAQIEANNAYVPGSSRISAWTMAFPKAPTPIAGDPVRLGTYNVMLAPTAGTRVHALARNVADHGLDVVALQEASATTARAIVGDSALTSDWKATSDATDQQQIIYNSARFRLETHGTFPILNHSNGSTIKIPWARLTSLRPTGAGHAQTFLVVSVHFTVTKGRSQAQQNAETGDSADAVMSEVDKLAVKGAPVIVAGDFTSNREPFGDFAANNPAQPTFVRAGYYDAMAAVTKVGYQYSTYNGNAAGTPTRQSPQLSGLGSRADYIVSRGIRGSKQYVNVANWSDSGRIPSDHNLVYADLQVPETR